MFRDRKFIFFLLAYSVIILLVTNIMPTSCNEASRLYTTQSLIREENFTIFDNLSSDDKFSACDVIYDGEHWYADKPPLMGTLTAIVYGGLFDDDVDFLTPITVSESYKFYIISLIFAGVPALLLVMVFYASLGLIGMPDRHKRMFTVFMGMGTMVLPFATVYAAHVLVACLWFFSFYFVLKHQIQKTRNYWLLTFAGSFIGFAAVIESAATMFFIIAVLIYLYGRQKDVKALLFFASGMTPWALIGIGLNYVTTGTMLPWQLIYRNFRHLPENAHRADMANLSFIEILRNYIRALITDRRSLMTTNLMSFIALVTTLWYSFKRSTYHREILVISSATFVFFLIIFSITNDFGGGTRTLRWVLPFVPLWMWALAAVYGTLRKEVRALIVAVGIVSIGVSLWMAIDPWASGSNFSFYNYIIWSLMS